MANFLADTRVERLAPGRYGAALSPDWAVWGPNGGYVSAIALRAALAESRLPRPASFSCHFLAVGEFAPVELRVASLGGSKRAESLRVEVLQKDRLLVAATVWTADDGLTGYAHDFAAAPGVPEPGALSGYQDLAGDEYAQWYPIWRSIEGRPLRWREPPGQPEWQTWLRFTDTEIPDRRSRRAAPALLARLPRLERHDRRACLAVSVPHAEPRPDRAVPRLRAGHALDARRRRRAARAGRPARLRLAALERGRAPPRHRHLEAHLPPEPGLRRGAGAGERARPGALSEPALRRAIPSRL